MEEVSITMLRIGHAGLNIIHFIEHIWAVCSLQATIKHILIDCNKYRWIRKNLKAALKKRKH